MLVKLLAKYPGKYLGLVARKLKTKIAQNKYFGWLGCGARRQCYDMWHL